MIRLRGVDAVRGRVTALEGIDVEITEGTVTAVVGPNGGGKSTLLAVISGRVRPARGTVRVEGAVADVLQSTAVDPQLRITVGDVVAMARYPSCGFLRPLRTADRRAVDEAMDRVGIGSLRDRSIGALSGGQRQRSLLAQGLAQDAPVLLLDEPTTGLDTPSRDRIMEIVREERRRGRTVVFATHDVVDLAGADLVLGLARRCLCCAPPAEALASGSLHQVLGAPLGWRSVREAVGTATPG